MKTCFKCGRTKDLSEYYAHKQMSDGHLNKCKDCTKSDAKERFMTKAEQPEWLERERERSREKYYRLGYREKYKPAPEVKRIVMKRYNERYPEKKAARVGLIERIDGFEAHHWSYKAEHKRDVIMLKPSAHALLHRFLRYDQSVFMYRDIHGNLLDTRDKHLKYAEEVLDNI